MPLARILTTFPERAESLAQQLREQGYSVEFLSPEKAGMLRADLEIDFEICDQKVVLRRAAELANKLHADIAVSPDALPANFAGMASEIRVSEHEIIEVPSHIPDPFVEKFLAQGDRTGQIHNLENSEHMVALPPDMLAAESPTAKAQQYQAQPGIEPNASEQMLPSDTSPQTAQPLRSLDVPIVPDPERQAEGSFGFETHNFEAQPFGTQDSESQDFAHQHFADQNFANQSFEKQGFEKEAQPLNQPAHQSTTVARPEWLDRALSLSSSAMVAARRLGADCAAWINVRMAAAQDARRHRQIEAEKQHEVARVRAEELEIARDAAAARLQELLRERGGLTDNQAVPPATYMHSEPQVAPEQNQAASPTFFGKLPMWFERFKDIALTRKYGQQWEAVLMGVAAACALFVVGVAVNSFRPHPAISNTITQPSSASAPVSAKAVSASPSSSNQPYNGVTVQSGKPGVTLLPSPAKTATSQPGPIQVANDKPSARESDVTVRHFNKPSPRNGGIASDVTIRHFNQQPKPAAHNTSDGVKRFSDLD